MGPRSVATKYQSAAVAEDYDRRRFRGVIGRYNNWRLLCLMTKILRCIGPGALAVDVACGTGRIEPCLLKGHWRVISLDISGAMLVVAQRKFPMSLAAPWFLRGDAHELPLRSRSVDAAFCIRFLHLLDAGARRTILGELMRVTRRWVVVEYRGLAKPLRRARHVVTRWITGHRHRSLTLADIAHELSECGLTLERHYHQSRWFSGSVVVVACRADVRTRPRPAVNATTMVE